MVGERGGTLYAIDERYCIDNGAMIAWPGLLAFMRGQTTPLHEATCTQRFRTDDVLVTWRSQAEILPAGGEPAGRAPAADGTALPVAAPAANGVSGSALLPRLVQT